MASSHLHEDLDLSEIEDELTVLNVLVHSLDPAASDYSVRLGDLEQQQTHFQRLRDSHFLSSGSRPLGHSSAEAQFGMNNPSDTCPADWWQVPINGRPETNGSDSSGIVEGGTADGFSYGFPTNGKRPRPHSSRLADHDHPSKRPTPEPSQLRASTSSVGPHEMSDQSSYNRALMRQQAAEAVSRRQYEQQQADEAFARLLDQQSRTPSSSAFFSRPSVQTTLDPNGMYQRPPPTVAAGPSYMRSQQLQQHIAEPHNQAPESQQFFKTEPGTSVQHKAVQQSQAPKPQRFFKAEPSTPVQHQLVQRPRQPTEVVDLTASDSEDDVGFSEVPPRNFMSHRHHPVANVNFNAYGMARPFNTPAPPTVRRPSTTPQMPGAWPINPGNRNSNFGSSSMGSSVNGNGNGNSFGNPWLTQAMNGFRNAASSLTAPVRELNDLINGSSSSRPLYLADDDDGDEADDIIFSGLRHLQGNGRYIGNEELYRNRFDALATYDPSKTKEEIQTLLENIRPDEEMPAHLRVKTPEALAVTLHKYQELGLTWLQKCEDGSNQGGVLADDMGLGKTVQMLSLMVTRKSQDPRCRTTLIIAPLALMRQWRQEIDKKVKTGHKLTVFTHHGSKKAKNFHELRAYDVVLTTYGSIATELKKEEKFRLRKIQDPSAQRHPKEKCVFLDENATWYRIVLDEAQCIKNRSTQTAKAACSLSAKYRFCVTGTPMMNSVEEFYSLIKFLKIKPYNQWEKFRVDISTPLKSGHEDTKMRAMQKLQALCKAVMLRRTKTSHFEGQPILVLPTRTTTIDNPEFSKDEREYYTALETQTQVKFNKYLREGTVGRSYSAILVLLLRLRQCCCHPHLIKDFAVAATADLQQDQLVEFAKQLEGSVVARIKEANGEFECPVCYDVTPNPAIFIPCGHDTCAECFARIADPASAIHRGEENAGIRCPNCRGHVDPKRLTDFTSFKMVHMPELLDDEDKRALEGGGSEDEESDTEEEDDDSSTNDDDEEDINDKTLGGFIVNENDVSDDDSDLDEAVKAEPLQENGIAGPSNLVPIMDNDTRKTTDGKRIKNSKSKGKSKKRKGKGKKTKKPKTSLTLADLKKQSLRSKAAKRRYLRRLRNSQNNMSSAKIEKTMEILKTIMEDPEGEKVLIFSQWTSLLDILEIHIVEAAYGYRRYDGSMTASMRGDAVDDFADDHNNVRIMLISLKAGNAGLNLNMASQVIILDPFWNPYIEEQAVDRAHRLGQQRPVKVHRLLIKETVEDRIIALQEKKRALISEALDEQQGHALSRLGVQELAYLFGITHDPSQRVDYQPQQTR